MNHTTETDNLKERTAKGLFWSVFGNAAQQVVTLVIGILLLRFLDVEDYGLVAMLTVYSIIAGNLQESGFTSALAIKREADERDFNAVFWFSIMVSAGLYATLFLAAPIIADFNRAPQLVVLGRVIFIGFFISSLGTAQAAWLFRHIMVRQKTSSQVAASLLSGAIGLACAIGGMGVWALVTMDLTYKLVYTSMLWYFSPWRPSLHIDLRPAWQMIGFGSKLLLTNILNTVNGQLLQSILGHYYNPLQVGYYSQANKWNTLGHSLLGGMIGSVAQPVLAKVEDDGQRQLRVFRKMLRFTSMLAFPAMFGLGLIGEVVPLMAGAKWAFCVPYIQVLCLGGAFIPVNGVFSNLMISRSHSDYYLLTTSLFLICQLALVVGFTRCTEMMPLLYAVSALQPLWLPVLYVPVRRLLQLRFIDVLTDVVPFILAAALSIAAGYAASTLLAQPILVVAVKIVVTATCYCLLMWACRVTEFSESLDFLLSRIKR